MEKSFYKFMKIAVAVSAFYGVALGLLTAKADGYTSTFSRLMYFTAQSNIWLGVLYTVLALFCLSKRKNNGAGMRRLYFLRYVAFVNITVTCVVYCGVLAPFAKPPFRPWALPNVWTHILTPALAAVDFFVDRKPIAHPRAVLICLSPAVLYFSLASVLGALHVNFGRGEQFPYFFVNYLSPVGLFGFSKQIPYVMGSIYWYVLFGGVMSLVAIVYKKASEGLDKRYKK